MFFESLSFIELRIQNMAYAIFPQLYILKFYLLISTRQHLIFTIHYCPIKSVKSRRDNTLLTVGFSLRRRHE
jgi:hypothetical protein